MSNDYAEFTERFTDPADTAFSAMALMLNSIAAMDVVSRIDFLERLQSAANAEEISKTDLIQCWGHEHIHVILNSVWKQTMDVTYDEAFEAQDSDDIPGIRSLCRNWCNGSWPHMPDDLMEVDVVTEWQSDEDDVAKVVYGDDDDAAHHLDELADQFACGGIQEHQIPWSVRETVKRMAFELIESAGDLGGS